MSSTIYTKKNSCSFPVNSTNPENHINKLTKIFNDLILLLGEDPQRAGLKDTATRAAKAYMFLTSGYNMDPKDIINNALFDCPNDEMVIVKDIELFSICEHHLLPFTGKCHVGYIPNGKVIGLSKIARIVDIYARRLQIQENLTKQIAESLTTTINSKGVIVIIEATHLCMAMRGVSKSSVITKTLATTGLLKENSDLKQEFLLALSNEKEPC